MHRVLISLYSVLVTTAANASELEYALIPGGTGLHVYDSGPTSGLAPRLVVAPLYPLALESLGTGRIFNLRPVAENLGVDPKPNDLILYSPESKLVFCRGTSDTIDKARIVFESHDHAKTSYQFTLFEGLAEPIKEMGEAAVAARRIAMRGSSVSGARFEVALNKAQSFSLDFTVDSGQRVDVVFIGRVQLGDSKVKISTACVGQKGKDILLFERSSAETPQRFDRLILRIDARPDEGQLHHDEGWQREQSIKIAREVDEMEKSNRVPGSS